MWGRYHTQPNSNKLRFKALPFDPDTVLRFRISGRLLTPRLTYLLSYLFDIDGRWTRVNMSGGARQTLHKKRMDPIIH